MTQHYQVIVVGLGAMGSAALYQLAKRGIKCLGIDRYDPPHALGSTHGETRITRQAIGEGVHYTPLSLRSYEIFRELEKKTNQELLNVTGGLFISSPRRKGVVHVENFFDQMLAAARSHDIKHDLLTGPEIKKRFVQFAVQDDEMGYYEYEAGFLRPERCVRVQLGLAKELGAEIRTKERVENIVEDKDAVAVITSSGEYRCAQLIVSAGPWLPDLFNGKLQQFFRVTRQVLFWFDIEAVYEQFVAPRFPVFIWEPQGVDAVYGIPAVDGPRGGVKIGSAQFMNSTSPDSVERNVSADEARTFYQQQGKPLFPHIGARCINSLVCLYTTTPNSEFIVDRLDPRSRIIVCSPCSGHGFKHSAAIGEAVSQLAIDGQSKIDLSPLTFARMSGVSS